MSGRKEPVYSRAVREEKDPAWRNWFMEVERKRKAVAGPKCRPLVFSVCDNDGDRGKITFRQTKPLHISKLIIRQEKKDGFASKGLMSLIQAAWRETVGEEIAEISQVEAFTKGVLNVTIFESCLLQEIRQFLSEGITGELRKHWPGEAPLVRIVYKPGKKK